MLISLAKTEATVPGSTTDECVELIRQYAEPIPPPRRPQFYERVSGLLRDGDVLSPALVVVACQKAQSEFLFASPIDEPHQPSKQVPRSPFRRRG
jgi:hypothetical protein